MAGYRKSGEKQFVNATTFNDQIKTQRNAYQGGSTSTMGIASDYSVFPDRREEVLVSSVDTMNSLDLSLPSETGNPDFIPSVDFNSNRSLSMYADLDNAKDRPNKKGPNLIAPDINNITAPTTDQAGTPEERQNKGFGWRDERNEPATPAATIGTYFSKHYSLNGNDSSAKPVLGEAKSPENDPFIKYDQPQQDLISEQLFI